MYVKTERDRITENREGEDERGVIRSVAEQMVGGPEKLDKDVKAGKVTENMQRGIQFYVFPRLFKSKTTMDRTKVCVCACVRACVSE